MKKWLVLGLVCCAIGVQAKAIDQLKVFMSGNKTLSANFNQTVSSKSKKEKAHGTVEIALPGKFRWTYAKPYEQLLIGDGSVLWIYDKELAQVTRKVMDDAIGSSPAALLSGSDALEKHYVLREIGKRGNLEWLSATPKDKDSSFQVVRMGLKNNMLVEMELNDSFGNITHLVFRDMKKNVPIPANRFAFTPPAGVDVITE